MKKVDKDVWVPIIAAFITSFITASIIGYVGYITNIKSNETQLRITHEANKNQVQISNEAIANQNRIAKEANTIQIESVRRTIDAQMQGIKLTTENTLKSIELNNENAKKIERAKEQAEQLTAARSLIADIDFRVIAISSVTSGLEQIFQNDNQGEIASVFGIQIVSDQNMPHFDVDQDYFHKKIHLLPEESALKVARFYGLLQTLARLLKKSSDLKKNSNDLLLMSMQYPNPMFRTVKEKELYLETQKFNKTMNKFLLSSYLYWGFSITQHGYRTLSDLYGLIKNHHLAQISADKSLEYTNKIQKYEKEGDILKKQMMDSFTKMPSMIIDETKK